ncbi:MmcQ/YjbR family DNA-binding protein [Corynebacterium halotolerans]|uniref:MmcQ/YjbR family DNA-binding protein n=1 Tax=Corynebacterium halotolerans YIM 70093 = DSM 44683 TaxID=1121362 RepID=M1NPG2_9CORY|nr:MmcQ/YjbR family DNA-binding protein [Corynebacterium halotolerans]AGF73278.1 hypothetical protein A605_11390 [Corynebacterium halotolerans YIM 70093 = DSM 44683]
MNIDETSPMSTAADVRRIVTSFPEVIEETIEDIPSFSVAGRMFARLRENETVLAFRVRDIDEQDMLLMAESQKYFITPSYEGRPIILVRLAHIDPEELTQLLTDAWEIRAPEELKPMSST